MSGRWGKRMAKSSFSHWLWCAAKLKSFSEWVGECEWERGRQIRIKVKNKTFGFALNFSCCWLTTTSWVMCDAAHIVNVLIFVEGSNHFIYSNNLSNVLHESITLWEFCSEILKIHISLSLRSYTKLNVLGARLKEINTLRNVLVPHILYICPFACSNTHNGIVHAPKGHLTDGRNLFKVKFWYCRFFPFQNHSFICPLNIHCWRHYLSRLLLLLLVVLMPLLLCYWYARTIFRFSISNWISIRFTFQFTCFSHFSSSFQCLFCLFVYLFIFSFRVCSVHSASAASHHSFLVSGTSVRSSVYVRSTWMAYTCYGSNSWLLHVNPTYAFAPHSSFISIPPFVLLAFTQRFTA